MSPLSLPPKTVPNLNHYRIVNLIWKRKTISRIEVADALGLTKSTVTKIVAQLLENEIVLEDDVNRTEGRGRPRVALRLNPAKGRVLGLELRTDGWTAVVTDLDGQVRERAAERRSWIADSLVSDVGDILVRWLEDRSPVPVALVGISVPGIADAKSGSLIRSNPLGIQSVLSLGSALEDRFGVPVSLENDARCGCWGELAFGSVGNDPFLFVLCEDRRHRLAEEPPYRVPAVGFGLVLAGKPWWGPDHAAGEFSSVLKRADNLLQFSLTAEETSRVFDDPVLEERVIDELARHVALFVNFLNLKAVYVSWPASGQGSRAVETMARRIQENWLYPTAVECRVQTPTGGPDAVAWGAAGLALERLWGEASFDDDQPRWK